MALTVGSRLAYAVIPPRSAKAAWARCTERGIQSSTAPRGNVVQRSGSKPSPVGSSMTNSPCSVRLPAHDLDTMELRGDGLPIKVRTGKAALGPGDRDRAVGTRYDPNLFDRFPLPWQ